MYQLSKFRTTCEKCGRITITELVSDVQVITRQTETGQMLYLTLCPEHKAAYLRILSDFLQGIPT